MPTSSPQGFLDRVLHGRVPLADPAHPALPLQGLTVLVVEDSRFASDAVRLLCQRSGARLRRVETLHAACGHLRVYRPDVIVIDLGLPDGRGDALIRDLAGRHPQGPVIIGISGDPDARADAMNAGAHGFLDKPFSSLLAFQAEIVRHLPDRAQRSAMTTPDSMLTADPLALRDDLEHAEGLSQANPDALQRRYLAGFVGGLARSTNDAALAAAVDAMAGDQGLDGLRAVLASRISRTATAFKCALP